MKKLLLLASFFALALGINAQNPFAYNISADAPADGAMTVRYTLNADAVSVGVVFMNGDTEAARVAIEGENTAGDHEVSVSLEGLPTGTELSWKVYAQGEAITSPGAIKRTTQGIWSPYGVVIDNDPQSAHFGRILITDCQANAPLTGNVRWPQASGVGLGLYEFTPQLTPVENNVGTYGYNGGYSLPYNTKYSSGQAIFLFKRLKITDDGRIFLSGAGLDSPALWEINPDDLSDWTPIFQGTQGEDGFVRDAEDNFVAGPNASFDVQGSGENLKILAYSCQNGYTFNPANYRLDEYNLGTATSWSTAPSRSIAELSGKYCVNAQAANVMYDNDGAIWWAQHRASPSETEPSVIRLNADGSQGIFNSTTPCPGAGMQFNQDFTLLAIASAAKQVTIYEVATVNSGDGAPRRALADTYEFQGKTFTKKWVLSMPGSANNAFAFDLANNIYNVSNSNEQLGVIALPRVNNVCEIPARDEFKFTLPEDQVQPLYLVGSMTGEGAGWDVNAAEEMTLEDGKYTIVKDLVAGDEFKFIGEKSWNGINLGADSNGSFELTNNYIGGQDLTLVNAGQNFKVMSDGEYTIVVDLDNLKANITKTVVDELYLVGNWIENWNPVNAEPFTKDEQTGKFTITKSFAANAEFKFIGEKSWNGLDLGAVSEGTFIVDPWLGGDLSLANRGENFKIEAAGEYKIEVDKVNLKAVITGINIPVTDIQIEDTEVTIALGGETYQINATVVPATATTPLQYESSDENVVTVSEIGLVTAVKSGTWETNVKPAPRLFDVEPAHANVTVSAPPTNVSKSIAFTVTNPTGVKNVNAAKTVAGKKYVNAAGMVSDKPFDGMNIIVTTYTDGSRVVEKVVK